MRELTAADLRSVANRASGKVSAADAHAMRQALYDVAAQLDRGAGERAELLRLRREVELLSVGSLRAERAAQPLANGGTQ
jgi:hypothetical protein